MDLFGIGSLLSGILNFIAQLTGQGINQSMNTETNKSNEQINRETNQTNLELNRQTNEANKQIASDTNRTNLEIQQSVNETNRQNTESTNALNKQIADDANALQLQMAETAYQRSTASNQISELVRAGYSYQQARMLIAGNLSPAAYQPSSPVVSELQTPLAEAAQMQSAQMHSVQMQPYRNNFAPFNMPSLPDLFSQSYNMQDGGVLGSMILSPVSEQIASHIDSVPEIALSSPADFVSYANSDGSPDWAKTLIQSNDWKRLNRSLLGQRAWRSWLKDNGMFVDWKKNFERQTISNRIALVNERLANLDVKSKGLSIDSQELQNQMGEIELKYFDLTKAENLKQLIKSGAIQDNNLAISAHNVQIGALTLQERQQLQDYTIGATIARLKSEALHADFDSAVYSSKDYKQSYISRLIADNNCAGAIALYLQYRNAGKLYQLRNDPALSSIAEIGEILKDSGITDSDIWSAVSKLKIDVKDPNNTSYSLLLGALSAGEFIQGLIR